MGGRIFRILVKEFQELKRDRAAWMRITIPSLAQMLLFGYAATFDVSHVSMAILDFDHSQESRTLIAAFAHNPRFEVVKVAERRAEVTRAIQRSDAALAVVVDAGFAALLEKGRDAPVQVILDGTNSNTALIALGYVGQITANLSESYSRDLMARTGGPPRTVQVTLETRPWYNPNLDSHWFFVPGVIATLTLVTIVNMTSFAIVREREIGTLEQIMVTPIRPVEFIIGKSVPFFLLGLGLVCFIALFGVLWFKVPFVGNPMVLLLGTTLYLLSILSLGLLISTLCATQQQAFATNFFLLNPLFTLSGFGFPIASMPVALQYFTYLNPLRYFLVIIRGVMLKGVGLDVLWPEALALAALGICLMSATILRFRKSLD